METEPASQRPRKNHRSISDSVKRECAGSQKQRVAFTNAAKPNTGVNVRLECLNETQTLAVTDKPLSTSAEQPDIGSPCIDVKRGNRTVSGNDACVLTLTSGLDRSMFCHPDLNVCVRACGSNTECPPAWQCDLRPESTEVTSGRGFCVNPTCGLD